MSKWYVAFVDSSGDDDRYEKFSSDRAAIDGFMRNHEPDEPGILEIWECNDDECLSPARMIYPEAGAWKKLED